MGALGFLLLWITALSVGAGFALLVLGGGYGWLMVAALPLLILLILGLRSWRRSGTVVRDPRPTSSKAPLPQSA